MPKKKSVRRNAEAFKKWAEGISHFLQTVGSGQSAEHASWLHDYAIIRLYREFERLMLHALVVAINNVSDTMSAVTGIEFPKHLTDEVCEYLIIGTGYFDFRGRDGLIGILRKYVPDDHYLLTAVKKSKYKKALERLACLRNFAAHESSPSKRAVLAAVGQKKIGSCGSWLKCQRRFDAIKDRLKELANEIEQRAPY